MSSKIFTFSNATLLVALALSAIAAWYSIIGLTAIFAGAIIPIIIMGSVLELAKITTTVWLRKYWQRCTWIMKVYLVPAVVALALLTSMGIFGFLSKAHLDQGVPTGDVAAKVALFDEKIKTERDNIETSRKALQQMDAQVDQMLGRTDSDKGAERAVAIRRQQQKERSALQSDIAKAQTVIAKLNEERAPIASELRKVEAEVGPIKYIAALIYGDNPDDNVLERAVRWVIILLVIVFDPLAIMLVIAANQSRDWDKEADYEQDDGPINMEALAALREVVNEPEKPEESDPTIQCYKCNTELVNVPGIGPFCPNKECDVLDNTKGVEISFATIPPTAEEEEVFKELEKKIAIAQPIVEPTIEEQMADTVEPEPIAKDDTPNYEGYKDTETGKWVQTGPAFEEPVQTIQPFKRLGDEYVEFEGQRIHRRVLKDLRPDLLALDADSPNTSKVSFGTRFPEIAFSGDIYTRVDTIPHRVFKFNGSKWIEVKRENMETHLTNDEYMQHLIEKLSTGEYDPDLLTPYESEFIAEYIKTDKV
jgi:hypothetical protein